MICSDNRALVRKQAGETMCISPCGKDGLRVRVTKNSRFIGDSWALLPQKDGGSEIWIAPDSAGTGPDAAPQYAASIANGRLKAVVSREGKLAFFNQNGALLLAEFEFGKSSCLNIRSRDLKCLAGETYAASMKFDSSPEEKLFGMGQYQNGIFDLKGSVLELAQRNSQASVPFLLSNLGYGFFWNNPAVGRASFGKNITEWEAYSTRQIEFWVTCGDTPAEILENYMRVTGLPPKMPEYGLGFWQCKLRYYNQEQVLGVVREYKRRGIPLDMIIIDFFHWPLEGDWRFDPEYWPDPEGMVREINGMGTKVMVSVWPTVSVRAENYREMKEKGYLIRAENGVDVDMLMIDPTSFVDMTNPEARKYLWEKIRKNYCGCGVRDFWLDEAEPEYSSYDLANYHYYKGNGLMTANEYPAMYAKTFYDGLRSEGAREPVNLIRCAWAGSQRYGALVWSGDIPSTFESMKKQIVCGMQMAMAGIPWWTTDIGGFHGGDVRDGKFRELLVRWFQFGAFCPVMRLHGDRSPFVEKIGDTGGGRCGSGADNEVWSYGGDNLRIFEKFIRIRENLRPYLRRIMNLCSRTGKPVIRPLFFEFPEDPNAWDCSDEYLFGDGILVAPVTEYGARSRKVYLPAGADWVGAFSGEVLRGGQTADCPAPLDELPVFLRRGNRNVTRAMFRCESTRDE